MLTRGVEPSRTEAADAVPWVVDVVGLLWPGAAVRAVPPRPGPPPESGEVELLALPSRTKPSMLVPASPPRATGAALVGSKTGAPARTRRLLRYAAAGARLGGARALPTRLRITPPPGRDQSFVGWIADELGERPLVAILGSPPRANRKPVIQLLSPEGESRGYAKIGTSELTRRLVVAEGEALRRLGALSIPGVRVPRLALAGEWNGYDVIVQHLLVPEGDQSWTPDELSDRFRAFALAEGTQQTSLTASPYIDRLTERLSALHATHSTAELRLALADLVAAGRDTELTLGMWHGDWTPWNMARSGPDLLLWDLERAEWGVPLGYDALHFRLQSTIVRDGVTPIGAARALLADAPSLLAAYGLTSDEARTTARLYLVELGTRYVADGQREAGGALSALERWLTPALQEDLRPGGAGG